MTKEQLENLTIILYMVPFIVGILGWLYYFVILDTVDRNLYNVFLMVSKDPIFFLTGFIGIVLATIADAKSSNGGLEKIMEKLDKIALTLIIIEILGAVIAVDLNFTKLFYLFIDGKYAVIFPLSLLIYSYLIPIGKMHLSRPSIISLLRGLAIIIMIASPTFVFYMHISRGLITPYIESVGIFLIGLVLFIIFNYYSLRGKFSSRVKEDQ